MYNATLYINTGFNAINIPDKPSLLEYAQKVTVPALDIYQVRELSSFVVKATYAQIKNADYLYLESTTDPADFAYYSIQNITMTSMDTAVLSVTMDYILTAGGSTGVSGLEFLDGICERHHVPLASDNFGAYDEDDPYMTPAEMLKVEVSTQQFSGSKDNVTLLASTVDLFAMNARMVSQQDLEGIDFTTGQNVCTVPRVYSVGQYSTTAQMYNSGSPYETKLPNEVFYMIDPGPFASIAGTVDWLPNALSYVRSLGIESCILAQYNVPGFMLDASIILSGGVHHYVSTIKGARLTLGISDLPFERSYGTTIRNKRLFYGDNAKYSIVSIASGNQASFLPEEIRGSSETHPTLEMRVDPRPKGAPYFRFDKYRGSSSDDLFFTNAVKGLEWQNAPLVYEGASGSLLNQYKYNAKQWSDIENKQFGMQSAELANQNANENALFSGIGSGLSAIGYGITGQWGAAAGAVADAAINANNIGYQNAQYALSQGHAQNSFTIAKNAELQSLLIQNKTVAPSMNFPISEGIRDFVGNTCLVYRTYYTDTDAARIDKILNMYGYKHTVPIETSFLTNRSKFNYIQARGVSIRNNNIPKWLRDGVAAQFSAGMRIWHVLPDATAYTDGSNT